MKSISLLQVLHVVVLLYEWFDIPILKRSYDFEIDHYNLQWQKAEIMDQIDSLLNKSGCSIYRNQVLYDLSIHYIVQLNKKLRTFEKIIYFRCVDRIIILFCDSYRLTFCCRETSAE